jgi:hypothetical protein
MNKGRDATTVGSSKTAGTPATAESSATAYERDACKSMGGSDRKDASINRKGHKQQKVQQGRTVESISETEGLNTAVSSETAICRDVRIEQATVGTLAIAAIPTAAWAPTTARNIKDNQKWWEHQEQKRR